MVGSGTPPMHSNRIPRNCDRIFLIFNIVCHWYRPESPTSQSRTTWSPSKLKKVQAQESRLNPVLGGLPPNEAASMIINEGMNSTIKHFRMINVKEHADAQFNVGGNLLYAHRCIINVRCPALLTKFVKEKQIKKGVTYIKVDDKQIDDPTLYAVLHYLYSDELLFHTMESSQVVNLLRAAQQYELQRLAWLAERYLKSVVTMGTQIDLSPSNHHFSDSKNFVQQKTSSFF
jgi:hypothetical protein